MVVPKSWDYIRVPVQVNVENELRSLNKLQTFLAPWKFCDETKLNPDSLPDTIESIVKQTQVAKCKNCSELRCIRSYLVFWEHNPQNMSKRITNWFSLEDMIAKC